MQEFHGGAIGCEAAKRDGGPALMTGRETAGVGEFVILSASIFPLSLSLFLFLTLGNGCASYKANS